MIDALLFTLSQSSVQYDVRAMTRCHSSTLAREFKRDYPQLSLIQWHEEDTESIRCCFDGCYGVFINTGVSPSPKATIQELTRTEIALGKRCLEAAEVSLHFDRFLRRRLIAIIGSQSIPYDLPNFRFHFQCERRPHQRPTIRDEVPDLS